MIDLSKIIIGTGSYDSVKSGNTVSVTGDGGNAWGYYGPAYKKLAPKLVTYKPYAKNYEELLRITDEEEYLNFRKHIEDEYIESYYNIRLKDLDIEKLLETLYEKFGDNIILLCHEPISEFCHRRLIADYIELKTGIYIPEISVDETGIITKDIPIRYKNRLRKLIDKSRNCDNCAYSFFILNEDGENLYCGYRPDEFYVDIVTPSYCCKDHVFIDGNFGPDEIDLKRKQKKAKLKK